MEDVDRPADIQALSEPAGARRSGVEAQTLSVMTPLESADRIGGHLGRWWDLGQGSAIRPTEPKRAVEPAMDSVALLVDRAVMPATEQREIGKRRRSPFRPVAEMVPLREADAAAGKATTSIAMIERPPQGGRNRPGPGPDFDRPPAFVMPHHHPAGIARQTARRFRGNAHTLLEDRTARLIRIGERRSIDVDHYLVAIARGAGIELVVKCRLGEQGQRICLLLGHRRRFRGNSLAGVRERLPRSLIQSLPCRLQRLHDHGADLRREAAADDDHTVLVLMHVQCSDRVAPGGLARLCMPVHLPPAAHDPLHVRGRALAPHGQQSCFSLRRGHTGQRSDLRVRQFASGERLGHERQRRVRARP